jgi:hypothetical protein
MNIIFFLRFLACFPCFRRNGKLMVECPYMYLPPQQLLNELAKILEICCSSHVVGGHSPFIPLNLCHFRKK